MSKPLKLLLTAFLLGVVQMVFLGLWLRYHWPVFLLVGLEIGSAVAVSICICVAAISVWRKYPQKELGGLVRSSLGH